MSIGVVSVGVASVEILSIEALSIKDSMAGGPIFAGTTLGPVEAAEERACI